MHGAASAIGRNKETPMPNYEHVFLARQDLSQAQVDALAEVATKIVEDNKGKVVKTETWGLRTLTYKIQKNRKAHFVMLDIEANGDTIAELERQLATARNGAALPAAAGASTAVFTNRAGRSTVLSVGPQGSFVVVNFGSARGAQLGHRLNISQGTIAVATAVISDVRAHFSVAQVQPESLRGVLQKGDSAVLIR